jgi:hypothetical protein
VINKGRWPRPEEEDFMTMIWGTQGTSISTNRYQGFELHQYYRRRRRRRKRKRRRS